MFLYQETWGSQSILQWRCGALQGAHVPFWGLSEEPDLQREGCSIRPVGLLA